MSLFPSAAQMRSVLGPVVSDAAERLGSRVTVYRAQRVRQRDGSTAQAAPVSVLSNVAVKLTMLTRERAQEVFGLDTDVRMKGTLRRGPDIQAGDILRVDAGGFTGSAFRVMAPPLENDIADKLTLALEEYAGSLPAED